jgi:endonuclease III related protein
MAAANAPDLHSLPENQSAKIRLNMSTLRPQLAEAYALLFDRLGPQRWWPGDSDFEVIVGAILTQNTSWTNVEQAIANLKSNGLLSTSGIKAVELPRLEELLRPAGYFRQKAKKLKAFVHFLSTEFDGSLETMFQLPTADLREKLLGVFGIGPETADSILLYAGRHAVFVVDAYTRRMLARHGWADENARYEEIRALFESELSANVSVFNEFHALIVSAGKQWCWRNAPRCQECPLQPLLEAGR